jgi:hypothetical protein
VDRYQAAVTNVSDIGEQKVFPVRKAKADHIHQETDWPRYYRYRFRIIF